MNDLLEEAQNLRLEGSTLKGLLKDRAGGWHNAEIDLDKHIGVEDGAPPPLPTAITPIHAPLTQKGHLTWSGKGFARDAKDLRIDRHAHKPELVATLRGADGREAQNELLLGERIENADGSFSVRPRRQPSLFSRGAPSEEDPFWRQNMSWGV